MRNVLQLVAFMVGTFLLTSCDTRTQTSSSWDLFSDVWRSKWQTSPMLAGGEIVADSEVFTLKAGAPMTGIVFPDWEKEGLPLTDYAISYEALRVSGSDFFGSVTFPVTSREKCVTFVLGGWGGSQVGISCIDGYDAAENSTGSSQRFENGQWYKLRLEIRAGSIQAWLDKRPIIHTNITGRQLSLRGGEIVHCVPFGFATYSTEGRIRHLKINRL